MATIRDIARVAGVSVTTVSRALNFYDDVNEQTREKIQKVAKELGYAPNRNAQNLVKGDSKTLAIILSGLEKDGGKDNIVYRLLAGMYAFAETVNYEVVLYTTSSAHQREKTYFQFCKEHNIKGAVLNGIRLDDVYFDELVNSDLPCVLIDVCVEGTNTTTITIDNESASKEMTQFLIEHRHQEIAFINGRKEAEVSLKREAGFRAACEAAGLNEKDTPVVYADFLDEVAYAETIKLMKAYPRLSGICCASDMMALAAIRAIKDMGKRVPEDISVTGFDDIPSASYSNPALTTVQQDFYLMGYYSAKELLRMIKGEDCEKNIFLEHRIIERASVAYRN